MIRDTLALTSLTAGFYSVWCATPGDADAAERAARAGASFGAEFALVALVLLIGWIAMHAVFPKTRRAPPADDAPDERADAIEQRARDTQS
jgi:hypothetical protein